VEIFFGNFLGDLCGRFAYFAVKSFTAKYAKDRQERKERLNLTCHEGLGHIPRPVQPD